MFAYIIKRLLAMLPVFFLVALVSFGIICLFPGDYYSTSILGMAMQGMPREQAFHTRQILRAMAGLDKPWIVQFWIWFKGGIVHGDWGVPLSVLLRPENGLGLTLVVTGSSMVWAWMLGIPLGILSAVRRRGWFDNTVSLLTYAGFAFPQYTWGWIFFWVMYKFINPLIIGSGVWGFVHYDMVGDPLTWTKALSHIAHLIPAWLIVGTPMFATVVRHTRMGVLDTLDEQYMVTARSKGLAEPRVLFKHAMRNALNPLVSMFGVMLPSLLVGSILVSEVLGFDTFGKVFLDACKFQNQYMLTAALLFYSAFLLVGNLISDLLLVVLDPRIRYD